MKYYFVKHSNGDITTSNWPIKETGAESYEFEVNELDLKAVEEGTKDWKIDNGKLSTVASNRKAEVEAKKAAEEAERAQKKADTQALKAKLSKGEASFAEVQEALNKLL